MTFQRPTNEPPLAAQSPIEPAEAAVESIAQSVEQARDDVASARQDALDDATSTEERAAVNARFDALQENVNEMGSRIETAITTGNAQLAATLTGFLDRFDARVNAGGGQGDAVDDDDILSIEEIAGDVADPAVGAAAAAGDAVAEAVDEAPSRVHGLLRPLWGGHK